MLLIWTLPRRIREKRVDQRKEKKTKRIVNLHFRRTRIITILFIYLIFQQS